MTTRGAGGPPRLSLERAPAQAAREAGRGFSSLEMPVVTLVVLVAWRVHRHPAALSHPVGDDPP